MVYGRPPPRLALSGEAKERGRRWKNHDAVLGDLLLEERRGQNESIGCESSTGAIAILSVITSSFLSYWTRLENVGRTTHLASTHVFTLLLIMIALLPYPI